jgi:hypothetical protein
MSRVIRWWSDDVQMSPKYAARQMVDIEDSLPWSLRPAVQRAESMFSRRMNTWSALWREDSSQPC